MDISAFVRTHDETTELLYNNSQRVDNQYEQNLIIFYFQKDFLFDLLYITKKR